MGFFKDPTLTVPADDDSGTSSPLDFLKKKKPSPVATPPGLLERGAKAFSQTMPGQMAGYMGQFPKGIAEALDKMAGPGAVNKALNVGALASGLGPEEIAGSAGLAALARLGGMTGLGAGAAKLSGQEPTMTGAIQGLRSGAIGEAANLATPAIQALADKRALGATITKFLSHLPSVGSEIAKGKDAWTVLKSYDTLQESRGTFARAMGAIGKALPAGAKDIRDPETGEMLDFMGARKRLQELGDKGWSDRGFGAAKEGDAAKAAQAHRRQLSDEVQARLSFHDPKLAAAYNQANRNAEKSIVLRQFASDPDLKGAIRIRTPKAQEKFAQAEWQSRLGTKLDPKEFEEFKNTLFRNDPLAPANIDRPGAGTRIGARVYGGGSGIRMPIPVPGEERPLFSKFVGEKSKMPKVLRTLAQLLANRLPEPTIGASDGSSQ